MGVKDGSAAQFRDGGCAVQLLWPRHGARREPLQTGAGVVARRRCRAVAYAHPPLLPRPPDGLLSTQAQAQFWKQRCAKENKVCVGSRDSLYPSLRAERREIKMERVKQLEARIAEEREGRLALQAELEALKAMVLERASSD